MSALIELESIARSFIVDDAELKILTDINLRVEAGQHVAIVGRSGTGKSTLLNIIGMLDTPSSGEYRFNGSSVNRLGEAARAKVRGRGFGFIFQSFNLINGLTTTENVYTPLLYASGSQFWTRNTRAKQLLEAVGLESKIDQSIERLSGGEQQRLRIAQALANDPKILLADEALLSLDLNHQYAVAELIHRFNRERGVAVVFVTHEINPIIEHVDRVLYLANGRFTVGSVEEVMTSETLTSLYGTPVSVLKSNGRYVVVGETHASDHCHIEGTDQNIHGSHLKSGLSEPQRTLHIPGGTTR